MTAIVCKGGFLRAPQESPYLDEDGEPECDLIAGSAYIDRDNNRYGDVRQMISPQDEINKRRSKALHLLNSKNVIADMGAVEDVEAARREIAKADGWVEKMPDAHLRNRGRARACCRPAPAIAGSQERDRRFWR